MSTAPGTAHWNQIEQLFHAALAMPPAEWATYLAGECGDNLALRQEVESLLAFSGRTLGDLKRSVETAAERLAWQEAGKQVGPYSLIRLLGDGGMGQVYLATRADKLYEQRVAIKLMHAGLKQAESMLLRFSAERQILANLNHPNIARLLDAGLAVDGAPYLVMEYVEGIRIDEYCRENKLAPRDILSLFLALCSAVEYAHKNLIVHRDIKPANILVTAGGVPKLLDFGIAKLLDADAGDALTRPTGRLMTPEYASPEQLRGDQVTTATDIYGLGVLLFELLTGERPFRLEDKSPLEIVHVICEQQPQVPSLVTRSHSGEGRQALRLDRDLDNMVLMAMRKEPSRRYASVSALSADVRAYLAGYPVHARTDRWSYRSTKFVRRHRAAVAAAAVAVLALIAFSVGMGLMARRANRAMVTAERETQFLNSIFQAATPDQAHGKPIMARDLLDQGTHRVDTELQDQPELQATMLDNVGRAYDAIGLYSQAGSLLQRAFLLRRRILGNGALATASTEEALATSIRRQSRFADAEPYFRDALAIRRRELAANDLQVVESLDDLGECLYLEDRFGEAEPILRQALDIERRSTHDDSGTTRNYLALVLERRGAFPEAAQLLSEALAIDKRVVGEDSANYLVSLHDYAGALIDSGDLDQAEATERRVLVLWEKFYGADYPEIFYPLNNLGYILLEKGEWQQAMPVLQRAIDVRRKIGPRDPKIAVALNNYGRAQQQEGDFAAAARSFEEALKLAGETGGQTSWTTARITDSEGQMEFQRGHYPAAEAAARRALEMQRKLGGTETPAYAATLIDLAEARLVQGDAEAAERMLRQSVEIREKQFNPGNPSILVVQVRLGEALTQEGKYAEAEPLLRQAADALRQQPFALPAWKLAEAESALGACLLGEGRTAEGQQLLHHSEHDLLSDPQPLFRRPANTRYSHAAPHAA